MVQEILKRIEETATPGTVIPKPETQNDYLVKGWGERRGERALVYSIPNYGNPGYPHEKGINESEWIRAFEQLTESGELSRSWFRRAMTACNEEGTCQFTTIGGIFELLGEAKYEGRGVYRKI